MVVQLLCHIRPVHGVMLTTTHGTCHLWAGLIEVTTVSHINFLYIVYNSKTPFLLS